MYVGTGLPTTDVTSTTTVELLISLALTKYVYLQQFPGCIPVCNIICKLLKRVKLR